jgi:hypothetical protein
VETGGQRVCIELPHHQPDLTAMVRGVVGQMLHQVRQTELCCTKRKHSPQSFFCHGMSEGGGSPTNAARMGYADLKKMEAENCYPNLKEDWTQVRPKKVAIPQGECRTAGRREKEQAIRKRFCSRMETALQQLQKTIATGKLKDRNRMERRLGKIQARNPSVSDLYEISLRETSEGVRLLWQMRENRRRWREAREGAYLLRTNLSAEMPEQLWLKYMQLTEAEASFRALKSELAVRPLFHQKEPRVKAHVMVAFLGYALWVTLKHLLKRRPALVPKPSVSGVDNAQPLSPMKALILLSKLHSADIVLPTTDGREIRLRRVTEPTAEQESCLHQLGIRLPDRLNFNRERSVDSATA